MCHQGAAEGKAKARALNSSGKPSAHQVQPSVLTKAQHVEVEQRSQSARGEVGLRRPGCLGEARVAPTVGSASAVVPLGHSPILDHSVFLSGGVISHSSPLPLPSPTLLRSGRLAWPVLRLLLQGQPVPRGRARLQSRPGVGVRGCLLRGLKREGLGTRGSREEVASGRPTLRKKAWPSRGP